MAWQADEEGPFSGGLNLLPPLQKTAEKAFDQQRGGMAISAPKHFSHSLVPLVGEKDLFHAVLSNLSFCGEVVDQNNHEGYLLSMRISW